MRPWSARKAPGLRRGNRLKQYQHQQYPRSTTRSPAVEFHHNLARAVVVHKLKLPNVAVLHHGLRGAAGAAGAAGTA